MENKEIRRAVVFALSFWGVWLIFRHLFGIFLPFLLGWLVAYLAEPGVQFFQNRFRFPRRAASAVAVTLGLGMLVTVLWLLIALGYRELSDLAGALPALAQTLTERTTMLRELVLGWVRRAPDSLVPALERVVSGLFSGGSTLLTNFVSGLLGAAGKLVGSLSGGLLTIGIGVLSGYMISGQFPALKKRWEALPLRSKLAPVAKRMKLAVGGWLKAQLKLMAVTFAIVTGGFLLLRVEGALLWGALTALVDAVPILGTGTVLIPWAVVSLLQGEVVRAIGMVGVYLTAMLTRSALEPRLVGRQLGLNPLVTLVALYAGLQLWGVPGMILSPILAVTASQIAAAGEDLR